MNVREIWRDVVGYESRYQVSSNGRVRTKERIGFHPFNKHGKPHYFKVSVKIRSTNLDRYGYAQTSLRGDNGKDRTVTIHTLVARAFIKGYNPGLQVNHKNMNRTDNNYKNLEWVTGSYNVRHSFSNGRMRPCGSMNGASKLKESDVRKILGLLKIGRTYKVIASKFGVTQTIISSISRNKTWKHVPRTL